MNFTAPIRTLKSLCTNMAEVVRDRQADNKNTKYEVGLVLKVVPGRVTDSETLSFLAALGDALSKLNGELFGQMELNVTAVNPVHETNMEEIERRMRPIMEMEQAAQQQKPSLVSLPTGGVSGQKA